MEQTKYFLQVPDNYKYFKIFICLELTNVLILKLSRNFARSYLNVECLPKLDTQPTMSPFCWEYSCMLLLLIIVWF